MAQTENNFKLLFFVVPPIFHRTFSFIALIDLSGFDALLNFDHKHFHSAIFLKNQSGLRRGRSPILADVRRNANDLLACVSPVIYDVILCPKSSDAVIFVVFQRG